MASGEVAPCPSSGSPSALSSEGTATSVPQSGTTTEGPQCLQRAASAQRACFVHTERVHGRIR
eukprot:7001069-Alexandrium_andersonii.AAC.1